MPAATVGLGKRLEQHARLSCKETPRPRQVPAVSSSGEPIRTLVPTAATAEPESGCRRRPRVRDRP